MEMNAKSHKDPRIIEYKFSSDDSNNSNQLKHPQNISGTRKGN